MEKAIADKNRVMSLRTKICIVLTLLIGTFVYTVLLKPLIGDTATRNYYFTTDTTAVNIGIDGTTTKTPTLGSKSSLLNAVYTYTTGRYVTATANTNWQAMQSFYGPAYGADTQLTAPSIIIGTYDANKATYSINWKADVYDYNPAGTAGNGTLLWTSNTVESHPNTPLATNLTFTGATMKVIPSGHRIKLVISCQQTNVNSKARLYWGSGTNYAYMQVSEASNVANSLTVTNLVDYNGGGLTSVMLGTNNVAMLRFDLTQNQAMNWTGGKLDKIGSNANLGDITFAIYKDTNGNGVFDPATDTLIPTNTNSFSQATGQGYTLTTPEAIGTNPQRYFIVMSVSVTAATGDTVGLRIADNSYFTVSGTGTPVVTNVNGASSSLPEIFGSGSPIEKIYLADWNAGTTLLNPETGGPSATNSACISSSVTDPVGTQLDGLLNYPVHSCASISGRFHISSEAQSKFVTLYFNGATGYPNNMVQVKGISFTFRASAPSTGGKFTVTMFYVKPDKTRVTSPVSSTYTIGSSSRGTNQLVVLSLAGQTFANIPNGSRLGIQIGVDRSGCGIGLGSSVSAQLRVEETAAANSNVDVGDGSTILNSSVMAGSPTNVVDSFTLTSSQSQTVNSITITGGATTITGAAASIDANVSNVALYADNGDTPGALDPNDTKLSVGTLTFSSGSLTISGLSEGVGPAPKRYLIVYDISANAQTNVILTGLVTNLTTTGIGVLGQNLDVTSAKLTVLPTTTVTNGAAEPAAVIIGPNGAATPVDAFGLQANGNSDTIKNVTVTLATTASIPPGTFISASIAKVEIIDKNTSAVYGSLTAPTTADNWQVPTTGLYATNTATECYVRITPKPNMSTPNHTTYPVYYPISASVTGITHTRLSYGVAINDTSSSTVTVDGEPPTNPVLTATTGSSGGDIQLSWTAATDTSGLSATKAYTVIRGLGNAPAPLDCSPSSGTIIYQGSAVSKNDSGLQPGYYYGYRVCATDVTNNNMTTGTRASAMASIPVVCTNPPDIGVNPMSQYARPGTPVQLKVSVTNKDTGACANSTFALSIVGTEDSTNFTTPSTFAGNNFTLAPNSGAASTTLTITPKSSAVQGATNTFHVRVTKNGGTYTDCPDPVMITVNNFGTMVHSSLQLGTRKYGSWGVNYNCSTCHSPNGTNIKQIKNIITTPLGDRPVVFTATSTVNSTKTGVFGNDLRSGTTSSNVCEVCHHNARFHQYSVSKVTWQGHNNSADCTKCHPHNQGFKATAGTKCDDCHGYPPTADGELVYPPTNAMKPFGSNAGTHATHQRRNLKCVTCHSNGNHVNSQTPAGDNLINIGFSINSSNFSGFKSSINTGTFTGNSVLGSPYSWSAAAGTNLNQVYSTTTCSVYCHGWSGGGGFNPTPSWTGINQVGCGGCHDATGPTPPTAGSHVKHAGSLPPGNGIACMKCHGTYNLTNYTSAAAHINGKVEWNLSQVSLSAKYKGSNIGTTGAVAPTNPASYGQCTNLYCHSNVQSANGTAGPTSYATPTWGGTTTCGSCHAEPNTSGGHSQHTVFGVTSFDCRVCHGSGGDANPLNHANGVINFLFTGLGENTHYSYSSAKIPGSGTYGNCYNSNCHGRRTITWGPSSSLNLCDKCHGSASTTAFYNTAGPGTTTSNTDPHVGAHARHLNLSTARARYSKAPTCDGCHITPTGPYAPGHIDSAGPAEVIFGTVANSGIQRGYTSVPTYDNSSQQCTNTWCHGAAMDSNTGSGAYASVVADGGTLFTPSVPVWNQTNYMTGNLSHDCNMCHSSPPPAPLPGYTHYGLGNDLTQCVNCHNHFKPDGTGFADPSRHVNGNVDSCLTCHGRPPVDLAGLVYPPINALDPGEVGAHNAHFLNPNIGNNCNACHNGYPITIMPAYKLYMGFNAYGGKVTSGTYWGYSTLTNEVIYTNSAGTIIRRTNDTGKANTCQNVYCHGATLTGGTTTSPNWQLGYTESACGACHATQSNYSTVGSHGRHAGGGATAQHLPCAICHGPKNDNYHVNGSVEWHLQTTDVRVGPTATYRNLSSGGTGAKAPSASYGTCFNVYCHSDGKGTYQTTPVWGGSKLNCGSCHKNKQTDASVDISHVKHAQTRAIPCVLCHYGAGYGTSKHPNGTIDVIFNPRVVGLTAAYNSSTKKCTNVACHNIVAGNLTWDVDSSLAGNAATCVGCHSGAPGNRAAVMVDFMGTSHHVQSASITAAACYQCHWESADTAGNKSTYHNTTTAKAVKLVIWNAATRPTTVTYNTTFVRYTANGGASRRRAELAKITKVCTGCHNSTNSATQAFGDGKTPESYSWDGYSIDERYNVSTTALWSRYSSSTHNFSSKTATKAFSAHGNATNNQRGWSTGDSTAGESYGTDTSDGVNVVCFDCHNSHGSLATGVMTSYSSATGRYQGGMLKTTASGKGGFSATYVPTAGGDPNPPNNNAYNPGAGICFDCHNTKSASSTIPWGYGTTAVGGTFGTTQAIYGYNDTPRFGNYTFASTKTYTYKKYNPDNKGGHFGASIPLTTTITQRTFPSGMKDLVPTAGTTVIQGLCTPCHDPHGVSPSLGTNQKFALPMLKGTWVTSPYKQDAAPARTNENRGGGAGSNAAQLKTGSIPGYHIDQNTRGASGAPVYSGATDSSATVNMWTFATSATTLQTYNDTQFAGLCMGCHNKTQLNNTAAVSEGNWMTMNRIHNAVKGWAVTTGSGGNRGNRMHAYTCSKCHTPHNYRLPRLLVTNCLDADHRGRVATGAPIPSPSGNGPQRGTSGSGAGRFPVGGGGYNTGTSAKNNYPWFFGKSTGKTTGNSLNTVLQTQTNCHGTDYSNGIYGNPENMTNKQQWNDKTPW